MDVRKGRRKMRMNLSHASLNMLVILFLHSELVMIFTVLFLSKPVKVNLEMKTSKLCNFLAVLPLR